MPKSRRTETIACYISRTGRALSIIATLAHIKVNLCRELTAATAEAYAPPDGFFCPDFAPPRTHNHYRYSLLHIKTAPPPPPPPPSSLFMPLCHFLWAKHLALHKANGHKTELGTWLKGEEKNKSKKRTRKNTDLTDS